MGFCGECEKRLNENDVKRERRTSVRGKSVVYVDFYYFECPHCNERYYVNGTAYSFKETTGDN